MGMLMMYVDYIWDQIIISASDIQLENRISEAV